MTQQSASSQQLNDTLSPNAVVELSEPDFKPTIAGNSVVFIDFWAPWCGPCRTFAPVYEAAAKKHPEFVFAKVNVDEQQQLAVKFGIRAIPTLAVFKDQAVVFSQAGALPPTTLDQIVQQAADQE